MIDGRNKSATCARKVLDYFFLIGELKKIVGNYFGGGPHTHVYVLRRCCACAAPCRPRGLTRTYTCSAFHLQERRYSVSCSLTRVYAPFLFVKKEISFFYIFLSYSFLSSLCCGVCESVCARVFQRWLKTSDSQCVQCVFSCVPNCAFSCALFVCRYNLLFIT